MKHLTPLRPLIPLSSEKPDELNERFEILVRPTANRHGHSCVARENNLNRSVRLQFFPPEIGNFGSEIAIAISNLNLPTSNRVFDIVKQSDGTTVLVSELVEAPVLSDWLKSASVVERAEIREQAFEWAGFWNQINDRKIRFNKDSIRVMRTPGGRPLCKIGDVVEAEDRADVFESLVELFNHSPRKTVSHETSPEVDDWFASLFEKDSDSPKLPRVPANLAVATVAVGLLGGLAGFLVAVF